jgi:hypothetical protein
MTSREYDMWICKILAYTRNSSGEKSFNAQMRLAGAICCSCMASLPTPHRLGKQLCARCKLAQTHRIHMNFMLRDGWECQFLEEYLKTAIRQHVIFRDSQKIREAAERGRSLTDAESRLAIDNDIKIGRGGIWLQLTDDQYQALRRGEK